MHKQTGLVIFSLIALFSGYVLLGWLLSVYEATWLVWVGTQAVTLHLAWAGTDAIALSVAWTVGVIWAGAFSMAWFKDIPWIGIFAWAMALLLVWTLSTVLALILAFTERKLQVTYLNKLHSFCFLIFTTEVGLVTGWLLNSMFPLASLF